MRIYWHPVQNFAGGTGPTPFSKEGVRFWLRRKGIKFKEARVPQFCYLDLGDGRKEFPMGHFDRIDAQISQADVTRHLLADRSLFSDVLDHLEQIKPTRRDDMDKKNNRITRILQHYGGKPSALSGLEKLLFSVLEAPSKLMLSFYFSENGDLIDFKLPIAEWMHEYFYSRAPDSADCKDYSVLFANDTVAIDFYKARFDHVYYRLVANILQEGVLIELAYNENSGSPHLICSQWIYDGRNWAQLPAEDPGWSFCHCNNLFGDSVKELVNKPLPIMGLANQEDTVPWLPREVRSRIAGEGNLSLVGSSSLPIKGAGKIRPLLTSEMVDRSCEIAALKESFKENAAEQIFYTLCGRFFFKHLQRRGLLKADILLKVPA
jgi:hypothetical protein